MKVLVVVDMQNDFIDGALGTPEAQAIVPNVVKKIKEYKENGGLVIYTMDTHTPNYLETMEGKKLPVPHCIKLTNGWEIHKDILDADKDYVDNLVEKETFGSDDVCRNIWRSMYDYEHRAHHNAESIEIVGLCTDICVISNAMIIKSEFIDIPIIVDSSCCAGVTPESHQRALEAMKMCHIDVI